MCALAIVLLTGAAADQAQWQAALDSYTSWLRTGVDGLVAEGAISTQLAKAVGDASGDAAYKKALQLAQQADVEAAILALLELSKRQSDVFAALREAAADNRDWVVAQILARDEAVPEALQAREYVTGEQKRAFILRRPVDWSVPAGQPVPHAPWQPPATRETAPALSIEPGKNLPYDPAALAALYGPPPTGPKYPRMPGEGPIPYDPAELVQFYGPGGD